MIKLVKISLKRLKPRTLKTLCHTANEMVTWNFGTYERIDKWNF